MFEKEAEAKYKEHLADPNYYESSEEESYLHGFKDGAEFGYNKAKEELKDAHKESVETQNKFIIQLLKELEEERKLNAEIKARFVKRNTCTECIMFTENICKGKRCEELIDVVSLVNNSDLKRKIEELEQENAELKSGCGMCYRKDKELLTKAKEIILKLYNAGRDVLMCRAEEKVYDNLDEAINNRSIEQFLKEVEK